MNGAILARAAWSREISKPLPPAARKTGSVGIPVGPEIAIMARAVLGRGKRGEIIFRGRNVMHVYAENAAANATSASNRWFQMGDQGCMDEDRYLF